MSIRKIIEINEDLCDGCANCIPGCPEGALQVIEGKARLISDLFCDGLGACIGECPTGAMKVVEKEAQPYDERKVMENIVRQGANTIKAHLKHLKDHGESAYLGQAIQYLNEKGVKNPLESNEQVHQHSGCPGSRMIDFSDKKKASSGSPNANLESELRQWPVQLHLVHPGAPYFRNADILVAADCVPFAYANFHQELLKGKALVIGCPKLDDTDAYKDKIRSIIEMSSPKSFTVAIMEVPCCGGLYHIVKEAVSESGSKVPVIKLVIGIDGNPRK